MQDSPAAAAGWGLGSWPMLPSGYLWDGRVCCLQMQGREPKEQAGVFVAVDFSKSNKEKVKDGLGKLRCRLG